MATITLDLFFQYLNCSRQAWYALHSKNSQENISDNYQDAQRNSIIPLALEYLKPYPGKAESLFDLNQNHIYAQVDILIHHKKRHKVVGLYPSIKLKRNFIKQEAVKTLLLQEAGQRVSKNSIYTVNPDYKKNMPLKDFFVEHEIDTELRNHYRYYHKILNRIKELWDEKEAPDAVYRFSCRKCPYFYQCMGKGVEYSIFDLPNLNREHFENLKEKECLNIHDIPEENDLNYYQNQALQALKDNQPFVGPYLKKELEALKWPVFYMDFETVMSAYPLYDAQLPFVHVPTQYSLFRSKKTGKISGKWSFIADPKTDSTCDFIESLLKKLGKEGSILVFSGSDKGTLKKIAQRFPEYHSDIEKILERMVDVQALIRKNFWHPKFQGSLALKIIGPVLAPNMHYDELNVNDGMQAVLEFIEMARGNLGWFEKRRIKKHLVKYCEQDALVLFYIHQALLKFIS